MEGRFLLSAEWPVLHESSFSDVARHVAPVAAKGAAPANHAVAGVRSGQSVRRLPAAKPSSQPVSSPLVNIEILGSASPNGPFVNSLHVSPGQTVYYEVLGELASIGTVNIQAPAVNTLVAGGKTNTINSKTAHSGVGGPFYDGINSLSFNLVDGAANPIQVSFNAASLATNPSTGDNYSAGIGARPGIARGKQLFDVRPIQRAGVFAGAVSMELILSGSFKVAAN
ncbi:MAG: hypothetical protein ABSH20_17625, partial [Tepidisphaeraceae bacterium]